MATDAENAATTTSQLWARLAELDSVPLSVRARLSYSDENGRQVGWTEYRAALVAMLDKIQSAPAGGSSLRQQAGGPFTVFG